MRPALVALLTALSLFACTRPVELVNPKTGSVLTGTHSLWSRSMSIVLPTGETATGAYTKLMTSDIGPESLFFGANFGELLGRHAAERVYGYVRMTGERGSVLEMIFTGDWLGHGYGVVRTSLQEEYRVTF
jgi:hypothetical protein